MMRMIKLHHPRKFVRVMNESIIKERENALRQEGAEMAFKRVIAKIRYGVTGPHSADDVIEFLVRDKAEIIGDVYGYEEK